MADLISRENLLAGIEELKLSPWYTRGKYEGDIMKITQEEAYAHRLYIERKEAVEVITDLCIKKEPAKEEYHDKTDR